jgi:hypothetical protein
MRRRLRFDQFAVGSEHGSGLVEVRKQTARAIGQGEITRGALGRHDQYSCGVVDEREARADAYQHTAERSSKTAQAF